MTNDLLVYPPEQILDPIQGDVIVWSYYDYEATLKLISEVSPFD